MKDMNIYIEKNDILPAFNSLGPVYTNSFLSKFSVYNDNSSYAITRQADKTPSYCCNCSLTSLK